MLVNSMLVKTLVISIYSYILHRLGCCDSAVGNVNVIYVLGTPAVRVDDSNPVYRHNYDVSGLFATYMPRSSIDATEDGWKR